jgi:hypothetical protein
MTTIKLTGEQRDQVLADVLSGNMSTEHHTALALRLFRRTSLSGHDTLVSLRAVVNQMAREHSVTREVLLGLFKGK